MNRSALKILPTILILYCFICIFFIAYQFSFFPFINSNYPIQKIKTDTISPSKAYQATLPLNPNFSWVESRYMLYQNKEQLGPKESNISLIRTEGNGSYTLTNHNLYFSTKKNTPITNQVFTILAPRIVNTSIVSWLLISLCIVLGYLHYILPLPVLRKMNISILLIIVLIISIEMFYHLQMLVIPRLSHDSDSYLEIANNILNSQWPFFGIRPPGYILFLVFVKILTHSSTLNNHYVVVGQILLSYFSAFTLIYATFRFSPVLAIFASIILFIFYINNPQVALYDHSLLSDSLLSSTLTFYIAFLLLCLYPKSKSFYWILLSICTTLAIYIKPVALFLLPLSIGLCTYMLYHPIYRSVKNVILFIVPGGALLCLFIFYNFFVSGFFGFSAFGPRNLIAASCYGFAFIKDSPNEQINAAHELTQTYFNKAGTYEILKNSWNRNELNKAFHAAYPWCAIKLASIFGKPGPVENSLEYTQASNKSILDAALYSIKEQPIIYLKFFVSGLQNYYYYILGLNSFYGLILSVTLMCLITHMIWVFISTKGKSILAFIVLYLLTYIFLHSLTICLVETALTRYMYNILFIPPLIVVIYAFFIINRNFEQQIVKE